eukprot:comp17950_c0_seq1/m.18274 comp17950_c0_seq1/g.18274  ORF comp17950_c0_seq1/g.18274 comp17950_c0_seq1/m.18274 type:complete len:556 (-) comp17950_c0_seq1:748-2415(-)
MASRIAPLSTALGSAYTALHTKGLLSLVPKATGCRLAAHDISYRYFSTKQGTNVGKEAEKDDIRHEGLRKIKEKFGLYPTYEARHTPLREFRDRYEQLANGEQVEGIKEVLVGRVTSVRESSSKLYFIDVMQDGKHIQVVASRQRFEDQEHFRLMTSTIRRGDIVEFHGHAGRTKVGELSLFIKDLRLLAPCQHDLPKLNTLTNVETRFRQRYLDLLVNTESREAIIMRAKLLQHLRSFLDSRGFLEVETPILAKQAGGANARPFTTQSNAMHTEFLLRIAPELYLKQLVIGGLERVYEIGKQFRNEGIDRTHNPEFTTCEFYMAYGDFNNIVNMTETFLSELVQKLHGRQQVTVKGRTQGAEHTIDFSPPFQRISVMEELEKRLGHSLALTERGLRERLASACSKHRLGPSDNCSETMLLDRLLSHFVEPLCVQPTFLVDFPQILSPLAKEHPTQAGLTQRFELYVAGWELCNAYAELNDPEEQRARFEAQAHARTQGDAEAQILDEDFCKALEYGLPPTAGWGMGLDRLLMLLSGHTQIREVLAFPVLKDRTS